MQPVYTVECDHYYFDDERVTEVHSMEAAQSEAERMLNVVADRYGAEEAEDCVVTISVVFAVRRVRVEATPTFRSEDITMPALGALAAVGFKSF